MTDCLLDEAVDKREGDWGVTLSMLNTFSSSCMSRLSEADW